MKVIELYLTLVKVSAVFLEEELVFFSYDINLALLMNVASPSVYFEILSRSGVVSFDRFIPDACLTLKLSYTLY